MEVFTYPVSAVMKLWHWLFSGPVGWDDSAAWLWSIVGLVITVRALIAPFTWMSMRNSRISANMRPEMHALAVRYARATDRASMAQFQRRKKALQKKHGYTPAAGCFPMVIQLAALIGLYRVMLMMARPSGGVEAHDQHTVGILGAQQVQDFLDATVRGVALPAYRSMDPEILAHLGTTKNVVGSLTAPYLILAVAFTTLNMILALFRMRETADPTNPVSRATGKLTIFFAIFTPLMLMNAGWLGPIPVAIIFYWFANNLWTLVQNSAMHAILTARMPLNAEYVAQRDAVRTQWKTFRTQLKQHKRQRRSLWRRIIFRPTQARALYTQLWQYDVASRMKLAAQKEERKKLMAAKKQAKKEIRAYRGQHRSGSGGAATSA